MSPCCSILSKNLPIFQNRLEEKTIINLINQEEGRLVQSKLNIYLLEEQVKTVKLYNQLIQNQDNLNNHTNRDKKGILEKKRVFNLHL